MKKSIKRQLLLWLIVPLISLALISTVASYYLGLALARGIYDTQLENSADSVVARMKLRGDSNTKVPYRLTVDLPPAALLLLRHNNQDRFYFQVRSPNGDIIAGDKLLPPAPPALPAYPSVKPPLSADPLQSQPAFRTVTIAGEEVRVVSLTVPTPEFPLEYVMVQAAETRNTRKELAGQITMGILLAQLILIVCGATAIWVGVGRGLLPLARVESAVESRAPGDLSPLSVEEPVEIMSLIKALNRLFKQLDRDIEMQKRFTSNAAHQLRTPLAVLGTYCNLALKMVKNGVKESEVKEVEEVLNELDGGINRMSKLVSRLLVLARSEPGVASTQQCSLINLSDVASQVTAANVPESINKKIELEFYAPSDPALVWGNKGNIEELIANLVENSILYTGPGGKIVVKIESDNGQTTLVVEDDGPGIAVSEREKVFERFYRVSGTEQAGTGLGLAIVKEIATSHNADVTISDGSSNCGTAIAVRFPVVPNA